MTQTTWELTKTTTEATPAPRRPRVQPSRRITLDTARKAYRDAYHQGARHYAAVRLLIHNPNRQHNRRAGWVAGYCDAEQAERRRRTNWFFRAAFRVRAWLGAK